MKDEDAGLVERLRDEATALSRAAWNRPDGGQDACIASNLATEAADRIAALKREVDTMAEALWRAEPAWANLRDCQEQADMHGERVTVSRQAVDETVAAIASALGQSGETNDG
jgi:hypothetical protein